MKGRTGDLSWQNSGEWENFRGRNSSLWEDKDWEDEDLHFLTYTWSVCLSRRHCQRLAKSIISISYFLPTTRLSAFTITLPKTCSQISLLKFLMLPPIQFKVVEDSLNHWNL